VPVSNGACCAKAPLTHPSVLADDTQLAGGVKVVVRGPMVVLMVVICRPVQTRDGAKASRDVRGMLQVKGIGKIELIGNCSALWHGEAHQLLVRTCSINIQQYAVAMRTHTDSRSLIGHEILLKGAPEAQASRIKQTVQLG
jgi:hypothetical protein